MMEVISKKAKANINRDRISQLPEPIIQHILSHLNSKESARTSFLSKSLFNAWSTRPVLDFDIACLNENFMNCLLKTLRFYQKERLPLHKFKLHIKGPQDKKARLRDLDLAENGLFCFIKLALSNGIVELDLGTNYFGLPFQHKDLEWCNLQKLKLQYLPIDDHTLSYMISSCPLLTYLHLEGCHGLNSIVSLRIPNLREFYLICPSDRKMRKLDVSAPKLETFNSKYVAAVHIDEGTSLKSLSLSNFFMKQEGFQRLLSSCPFLEDLRVNWSCLIKTLVVSSHYIKILKFEECHNLDNVNIDAPNLQLLEYICRYRVQSLPFVISRAERKAKCCSITWCENDSVLNHSATIRQLMTSFQSTNLTVQSESCEPLPYVLEKWNNGAMTLQPIVEHHLESLSLEFYIIKEAKIEGFLQVYRPKYFICEYFDWIGNHKIMRKLCVELWTINKCARENLHYDGCGGWFDCRCWRHYIKEARICYVVGNEHKPLNNYELVSLSRAGMRRKVKVKISFALDWK